MINNIKTTLKNLDLDVSDLPGMITIIVLFCVALETLGGVLSLAKTLSIPGWVYHPGMIVISIVLSGLIYNIGSVWDNIFSDPFYGVEGRWISEEKPQFLLFPPGINLKNARGEATQTLGPLYPNDITMRKTHTPYSPQGKQDKYEGQYDVSKRILVSCGEWDKIKRGKLTWSKIYRSLIIPLFLISLIFLYLAINSLSSKSTNNSLPEIFFVISVVCIISAFIALRANITWRIENQIEMYNRASQLVQESQACAMPPQEAK